jgi:hypothetical protein
MRSRQCTQSFQLLKTPKPKIMQKPYPAFANLPVDKNGPRGNAWGLWGPEDQLGTLNHLTAERVRAAAQEEIKTGDRVSLK